MKKMIAIILAAIMLLGCLSACSSKGGEAPEGVDKDSKGYFASEDAGKLVMPAEGLDAAKIYANIEYVPQMFYGYYGLSGTMGFDADEKVLEEYRADMNFVAPETFCADTESKVTEIPYTICVGPGNLNHLITNIKEYDWMRIHLQSEAGYLVSVMGAYEVSGNTLTFYPLSEYNYDNETNKISYKLMEKGIEYGFSFCGPNITLTRGGKSVVMCSRDFDDSWEYASADTSLTEGSPSIGNIDEIKVYNSKDYSNFTLRTLDGEYIPNGVAYFDYNGLCTFSWQDEEGKDNIYQYVYFFCGDDGLIFADETTTYFYNDTWFSTSVSDLAASLSYEDMEKLANMSEDQIKEIEEKRTSLLTDLSAGFEQAGIEVAINEATGEIALDSAILFGYNESELTEDGKSFINEFMNVYSAVVLSDSYDGFVSKILVEGHTDSSGDYDDNLTLSENRANSVKTYCLSSECGLDAAITSSLEGLMQSVGYSSDQLVRDEAGNEDAGASRRVSFRFLINLG